MATCQVLKSRENYCVHTSSFLISIPSLSEFNESSLHPPSEIEIANVPLSMLVSMASPTSVVAHFHLVGAFASQGAMKRWQFEPYLLSFSAAITFASCIPAVARIGHEHCLTWPDKKMSHCWCDKLECIIFLYTSCWLNWMGIIWVVVPGDFGGIE